jgi:hypothetical protein
VLTRSLWDPIRHESPVDICLCIAENSWIHRLSRRADGIDDGIAAANWEGEK